MTHHMNCDDAQALIPDLLDGTLDDAARASWDAHAATCAECSALASDLASIRDQAAALPTMTPSRDLWAGIESRLDTPVLAMERPTRTPRRWSTRQVAAAAAILMTVTAGGTWMLATRNVTETTPLAAAPMRADLVSVADQKGIATYESEIGKLRAILQDRRADLDSSTVATLEKNIALIDQAIAESKAALAADPASDFLAGRLNHAYDTKLELLRAAATMPSRS